MSNICITAYRSLNRLSLKCFQNLKPYHSRNILQARFLNNNAIKIFKDNSLLITAPYCDINKRYRHSKKNEEESDSDDDDDEKLQYWVNKDKSLNKISKVSRLSINSLRLDLILKSGLNISRNKIETIFYESKIRLNGKKIAKKSCPINVDDEIDIIKGPSPDNPSNLVVSRLEILDIGVRNEKIAVIVRKYKSMVIENNEAEQLS